MSFGGNFMNYLAMCSELLCFLFEFYCYFVLVVDDYAISNIFLHIKLCVCVLFQSHMHFSFHRIRFPVQRLQSRFLCIQIILSEKRLKLASLKGKRKMAWE